MADFLARAAKLPLAHQPGERFRIDPKEDMMVLLLGQHMPFSQDVFWRFSNLVYAALN
jgi:hypothetical protein